MVRVNDNGGLGAKPDVIDWLTWSAVTKQTHRAAFDSIMVIVVFFFFLLCDRSCSCVRDQICEFGVLIVLIVSHSRTLSRVPAQVFSIATS